MTRDFDERYIPRIPAENDPEGDTFDLYLESCHDASAPGRIPEDRKGLASIRFVLHGGEFSLVGIPHESLLLIANSIKSYVRHRKEVEDS